MTLKRGIDKAVTSIHRGAESLSKPTKEQKEIAQVGTISATTTPPSARSSPRR